MRHLYTRWLLVMWMIILTANLTAAQIILHEATDITQTKATLSADFPDLNAEHGFQYKYGTLPEIDEFSKTALHPLSDPVQIENNGSNPWSARSVKGWIESNGNIQAGEESSVSMEFTIYEPTEISFEWSVDSEEGHGTLNFIVDDEPITQISGLIGFSTYNHPLSKGKHKIKWCYSKISSSNVGLDLGFVKNIILYNSTPGSWQDAYSTNNNVKLTDLSPYSSYIFRAFSKNDNSDTFSKINSFVTDSIQHSAPVVTTTQTTAVIKPSMMAGDLKCTSKLLFYRNIDPFTLSLISPQYPELNINLNLDYDETKWSSTDSCVMLQGNEDFFDKPLKISFENKEPVHVTLQCGIRGGHKEGQGGFWGTTWYWIGNRGYYKIDDEFIHEFQAYGKEEYKNEYKLTNVSHTLFPGKHTIEIWASNSSNKWSKETDLIVKNLNITPTTQNNTPGTGATNSFSIFKQKNYNPFENKEEYDLDENNNSVKITDLLPGHTYWARTVLKSNLSEDNYNHWEDKYSPVVKFVTDSVKIEAGPTSEVHQSSAVLTGSIYNGDAVVETIGFQFKNKDSLSWVTLSLDSKDKTFKYLQSRLRPSTPYQYRAYCIPQSCDTVFSEIIDFFTLPVKAEKPEVVKVSQHEATLQGKVIFGDANIYQRGLHFRKKGDSSWDEVEDAGNDSIYTLIKKNLEMGSTYEARTYVQPAGCDLIYSEILEFTTLDTYITNCKKVGATQTTITLEASLTEQDEDSNMEYGFEYYIYGDGFFENEETFVKSDIISVPAIPDGKLLKATITGLTPSLNIRWRAYVIADGKRYYYTEYANTEWAFAITERALLNVSVLNMTQTSISLKLDATQKGDAQISQIEYALANSVQDTEEYHICGNTLTITDLKPETKYNLRFRGLVNNRYCPLMKEPSWDYSWFEYSTLPVSINVIFYDITQTKAKMRIEADGGDASITDLRYSFLNNGVEPYTGEVTLTHLSPQTTYSITVYCKVNGIDYVYSAKPGTSTQFKFTTKSVTSNLSISDITQTAARCNWSSNYGDATFVASGVEIGSATYDFTEDSGEELLLELLPNTSYSCRSFVQTAEGGTVYSSVKNFTTKSISCETLPVSNISNRSATMNGTIDCDSFSSTDFGFQWKQMEGWNSDPAFTKGRKLDDGTISVALVNGMLEPNTDYQYRTAVRYQGNFYPASEWKTFRTESEFVYYPASVYTIFRTDRENNSLILCGYYVAGSESVISQGYEYWRNDGQSMPMRAAQTHVVVNTDESMQHVFTPGELADGSYSVRAFVKTESGETTYGSILQFTSSNEGYFSSINEDIMLDHPAIIVENNTVKIYNSANNDCYVYGMDGILIDHRKISSDYEEMHLNSSNYYIIKTSNGLIKKVRL